MIRLGAAIVILAVVALVVRRAAKIKQTPDAVRVAARAGITRGTMAAVLEVDQRRWLVTVTGSATTVVAELDPVSVLDGSDATEVDEADVAVPAVDPRLPVRGRGARHRAAPSRSAHKARSPRTPRAPRTRGSRRERVGLVERARRRTTRSYDSGIDAAVGERS